MNNSNIEWCQVLFNIQLYIYSFLWYSKATENFHLWLKCFNSFAFVVALKRKILSVSTVRLNHCYREHCKWKQWNKNIRFIWTIWLWRQTTPLLASNSLFGYTSTSSITESKPLQSDTLEVIDDAEPCKNRPPPLPPPSNHSFVDEEIYFSQADCVPPIDHNQNSDENIEVLHAIVNASDSTPNESSSRTEVQEACHSINGETYTYTSFSTTKYVRV